MSKEKISIDLNSPEFQSDLFSLEKIEQLALLRCFKKIQQLTWTEFYADRGLKWEAILSKETKCGDKIYSFRFSNKYRALAIRQGDFLRVLTLHVDHDSAY